MSVRAMSSVLRIQKTQLIRLMIQNVVWVILAGVMKAVKANWYLYVVAVAKVYKSNQSMQYSKASNSPVYRQQTAYSLEQIVGLWSQHFASIQLRVCWPKDFRAFQ